MVNVQQVLGILLLAFHCQLRPCRLAHIMGGGVGIALSSIIHPQASRQGGVCKGAVVLSRRERSCSPDEGQLDLPSWEGLWLSVRLQQPRGWCSCVFLEGRERVPQWWWV